MSEIATPIKSPYGKVTTVLQYDVEYCIRVDTGTDVKYFWAKNWTYFEKDMVEQVSEEYFKDFFTTNRF